MIFPRMAIAEVAQSNGSQSRLRRLPYMLPALAAGAMLALAPTPSGPDANGYRNRRYVLIGMQATLVTSLFARPMPERWRPVNSWLDRP